MSESNCFQGDDELNSYLTYIRQCRDAFNARFDRQKKLEATLTLLTEQLEFAVHERNFELSLDLLQHILAHQNQIRMLYLQPLEHTSHFAEVITCEPPLLPLSEELTDESESGIYDELTEFARNISQRSIIESEEPESAELIEDTTPIVLPILPTIGEEQVQTMQKMEVEYGILQQSAAQNSGFLPRSYHYRLTSLICKSRAFSIDLNSYSSTGDIMQKLNELMSGLEFEAYNIESDRELLQFCLREEINDIQYWTDLASAYQLTADAQDAFDWYLQNKITNKELLNTIGAAQQLLYRILQEENMSDSSQQKLYQCILDETKSTGFIGSLNPAVPNNDLRSLAGQLKNVFTTVKTDKQRRDESEQRRQDQESAMAQLKQLLESNPHLGKNPDTLPADRQLLLEVLDQCKQASLPPSHKEIKTMLVPLCFLLTGQSKYKTFLKYAFEEKQRLEAADKLKTLDNESQQEESSISDEELQQWVDSLQTVLQGKKIVIAGGQKPQQETREWLEQHLNAETKWLWGSADSPATKFEADVRKADILMVVIKISGHDMSEKGKKWMDETGGVFIPVKCGFGRKGLVKTLYQYMKSKGQINAD